MVKDKSNTTIFNHLALLRNRILSKVETDYLLSCDSDILVPPHIINKLLSHKKDIVAGLIFNGYHISPNEPWKYPNILKVMSDGELEHIFNTYVKKAPTSTEGKLLEVSCTGAVCLMSEEVCKSTRYGFHEWGEDIEWSFDCAAKGYKLYCDTGVFAHHIMSQQMLDDYLLHK